MLAPSTYRRTSENAIGLVRQRNGSACGLPTLGIPIACFTSHTSQRPLDELSSWKMPDASSASKNPPSTRTYVGDASGMGASEKACDLELPPLASKNAHVVV